jgi:hypothetical protein
MLMTRMTVTRGDDPAVGAVPGLRDVRPARDDRDGRELAGVRRVARIRVPRIRVARIRVARIRVARIPGSQIPGPRTR